MKIEFSTLPKRIQESIFLLPMLAINPVLAILYIVGKIPFSPIMFSLAVFGTVIFVVHLVILQNWVNKEQKNTKTEV